MSESRTLEESISAFVDARLRGMRVSMPGSVIAYDAATQKADVQPLIQDSFVNQEGESVTRSLPPILDVPVEFQGSGAYGMTFPVAKGDIVLLVFTDFAIGKWLAQGAPSVDGKPSPVDPLDSRSHHITDAVAIPGLRTFNDPTPDVASDSNVIRGKTRIGSKDAADPVVRESDLAALKVWIDAHVHPDPVSGVTGVPGFPTPNPSPTVTGTSEVLVD